MSERPLWAPWRIEYITQPKDGECVFCTAVAGSDARGLVLERGARCFSLLNSYPYASGHVMVAPYRHVAGLDDLDDAELLCLMQLARRSMRGLRDVMSPDGFNVGLNQGRVAGAGVLGHLHIHLVPRWSGDTNFMPIIGETRVLPESLETTYDRLAAALAST